MVIQVAAQVIGNDATISVGGLFGNFELNTMMPVIAYNLLQSIELLTNASRIFARRCVAALEANVERCEASIERSLALSTGLAPVIGYDQAAKIAKVAYETNRTVREVAAEMSGLDAKTLDEILDARKTG
jgi:fumarate hydratase class II